MSLARTGVVSSVASRGRLAAMSWPVGARKWSPEEIFGDVIQAAADFRERRLGEPKDKYLQAFELLETANGELVGSLSRLAERPVDTEWLASALANEHLKTALRYVGAPPISEDDLETLTGSSLAPAKVRASGALAEQLCDFLLRILDPKRFPWIYDKRAATPEEIARAVLASAVVAATQRVQTARRRDERIAVEGAVRGLLVGAGWSCVSKPRSGITNIRSHAPQAGEFMEGVTLGVNGADFVIGLRDGRILAIECKGSNSEINSRKRLNKEVVNDARAWLREFGDQMLVPATAIQGVFKPAYIAAVQDIPVVFFWGHRLEDLRKFLETAI